MDGQRVQEQRTKGIKRKASPDCQSRKRTRKNNRDKEEPSAQLKNRRLLNILLTDQESSSAGTSTEHRTRGIKRKASPDCQSRKRTRENIRDKEEPSDPLKNRRLLDILPTHQESSSVGTTTERRMKGIKRKASPDFKFRKRTRKSSQDKEEPSAQLKNKRLLDILQTHQESSSVGTTTESSCLDFQASSRSVGDPGRITGKRKADTDGEGPARKRRKRSPVLTVIREEAEDESEEDSVVSRRAAFEAKYEQQDQLGQGGCGSVFAGYRKADNLPVAIKRVAKDKIYFKHKDQNGRRVSVEVAVMQKLGSGATGSVSLLDWYDLQQELVLVLERPEPAKDLLNYIRARGSCCLEEQEAKIILKQLVEAAVHLQSKNIFHRDIKLENILIETSSDGPRVHLIDFGLSCFFKKRSSFYVFAGTRDHTPPEWYRSSRYTAGPTTVWQLGVVLFETLHSRVDFKTRRFLKNKVRISRRLSQDCRDFLKMCLAKLPEDRPTLEEIRRHPWLR